MTYKRKTLSVETAKQDIIEIMNQRLEGRRVKSFIPTGIGELAIKAVGQDYKKKGNFKIVNVQGPNKIGKTCIISVILANIIGIRNDTEWFDYPLYKGMQFINEETQDEVKNIRIISTPDHIKDTGPIWDEINKWWPKGRYTRSKNNKGYYSQVITDTGWTINILSNRLQREQYEGPIQCIQWIDEPLSNVSFFDPIMSRFSSGGMLLLSQTPVNCGAMLSVLEDYKEKGIEYYEPFYGYDIWSNSTTKGLWNSKKTRRGIENDEKIQAFIDKISPDEYDARVKGIGHEKSGIIYKEFDEKIHVSMAPTSFEDERFAEADCFCVMDPHLKRYPFITWWALFPPDKAGKRIKVCYNEWPTYETFNGYYDQHHNKQFEMGPKNLANLIKAFDMEPYGCKVTTRILDPRYVGNKEIIQQMALEGLSFSYGPREGIDEQRKNIIQDLIYNKILPINEYNEPMAYVMSHCKNVIRALKRHHYDVTLGSEKEAELYKDPIDTIRYLYSVLVHKRWISWRDTMDNPYKNNSSSIIVGNIEKEFRDAIKMGRLG